MKTTLAATSLSLALLFAAPPSFAQDPAESRAQIEAVIETFRKAIVEKDVASFMPLFLREDISWVGVYTDGSVERYHARLKDPKAPRPPRSFSSTPRRFIENIARSTDSRAETFSNVRIDTDGDVAQVWFDYSYLIGDYRNNWGKESWQMVRTETGWKIAGVAWSMEENPVPRPPRAAGAQ